MQSSGRRMKSIRSFVRAIKIPALVIGGAGVFAGGLVACQPGVLPCEDAPICEPWLASFDGGGAPVGGGGGGGSGTKMDAAATGGAGMGGAGMAGSMAGMAGGGAGSGGTVTAMTAVMGCTAAPTVKDVEEKILKPKCGLCHNGAATPIGPTDMTTVGDMFKRFLDVDAKGVNCVTGTKAKIIAKGKATDSLLYKVMENPFACPSGTGSTVGTLKDMKGHAGGADNEECIKNYVKAVAGN